MTIEVKKAVFDDLVGALTLIQSKALWPTTYATTEATAAELHWHSETIYGFVVSGNFHLLDAEGNRFDANSGDAFVVPKGCLHAEGEINAPVEIIIALEEALPMDRFLLPRSPQEQPS
jgi:gentisate 1,2-dioxygenase